jgi:NAD(P)-dependent dehydrogenase (short-subunit alcohol dehydrogenase family)
MKNYLEGKTALLTGAAKGIGEETAYCFAEYGIAGLVLVDRDADGLNGVMRNVLKRHPNVSVLVRPSDVKNESGCISNVAEAVKSFGRLDIVVNIAGVSRYSALDELPLEDWEDMIGINLTGTFLYCREAFRYMKKQQSGRIINIASVAPYIGGLTVGGHYVASKGAVIALSRHVAKAGAPYNILCNTVAPGTIETGMIADYDKSVAHIPLGHRGTPRDVAHAILFFASELSSFITGQCLGVNGGISFQ